MPSAQCFGAAAISKKLNKIGKLLEIMENLARKWTVMGAHHQYVGVKMERNGKCI